MESNPRNCSEFAPKVERMPSLCAKILRLRYFGVDPKVPTHFFEENQGHMSSFGSRKPHSS